MPSSSGTAFPALQPKVPRKFPLTYTHRHVIHTTHTCVVCVHVYLCICLCVPMSVCVCMYVCIHSMCAHVCVAMWEARGMLHILLYHCPPCFFDAGSPADPGTFSPNVFLSLPHSVLGFNTCQMMARIFMCVLGSKFYSLCLQNKPSYPLKYLSSPHTQFLRNNKDLRIWE